MTPKAVKTKHEKPGEILQQTHVVSRNILITVIGCIKMDCITQYCLVLFLLHFKIKWKGLVLCTVTVIISHRHVLIVKRMLEFSWTRVLYILLSEMSRNASRGALRDDLNDRLQRYKLMLTFF